MSKNYINKTGKHWYNNGVVQVQALECPEGFVAGRLPIADETKKKISKSLIGHPSSCKGVPKSEETKRKISETRKERKYKCGIRVLLLKLMKELQEMVKQQKKHESNVEITLHGTKVSPKMTQECGTTMKGLLRA